MSVSTVLMANKGLIFINDWYQIFYVSTLDKNRYISEIFHEIPSALKMSTHYVVLSNVELIMVYDFPTLHC